MALFQRRPAAQGDPASGSAFETQLLAAFGPGEDDESGSQGGGLFG